MKILLIGHSIIDHFEDSEVHEVFPGGLYYSTAGILCVKKKEDQIYLITGINQQHYSLFENIYEKIDLSLSTEIAAMPEVFLRTKGKKEREEFYKNISFELSFEKVNEWNLFDGILINMITGFDMSLHKFDEIRNSYKGKIYFDVHTLSRGVDEQLKREFRKIPEIEKWLKNIDIIQCNENELKTVYESEDEEGAASFILNNGPGILIITKGGNGITCYFPENNNISKLNLTAEYVVVKNKIGCGDIFGAVFFYSYLNSGNLESSLKLANKIAGYSVSINVLNNPEKLILYDRK